MDISSFLIIAVLAFLVLFVIVLYNSLVSKRNSVKNATSQIDVQLQRRFDLIPNLIETVKGYVQHEEKVLIELTKLRNNFDNAKNITEKDELNEKLSTSFKSVFALAENYPDLKANTNFVELQRELKNTEDKISIARREYNEAVNIYNTALEIFPSNIVGKLWAFKKAELFKNVSDEVKENIKVKF